MNAVIADPATAAQVNFIKLLINSDFDLKKDGAPAEFIIFLPSSSNMDFSIDVYSGFTIKKALS